MAMEMSLQASQVDAEITPRLQWKDIEMSITTTTGEKRKILKSISGELYPGQLTAVLGPSGAGKTTLMNLLAGRNQITEGRVKLDGQKINPLDCRDKFAYVMQADSLWPTATVRESIDFAARLRVIPDRQAKVEKLIEQLGLQKCADNMNGGDRIRGTSGGERKRTSIGIELVQDPDLILLDEPTSGLDSESAVSVVKLLKYLAVEKNAAVLCTIHQPSSEIFQLFDHAIFLSGGSNPELSGHVVYQGPVDGMPKYFEGLGNNKEYALPVGYNIADHVMSMCHRDDDIKLLKDANTLTRDKEPWSAKGPPKDGDAFTTRPSTELMSPKARTIIRKTNFLTQAAPLILREWRNVYRDKAALGARFGACAFLGLLQGCIFYQVGDINNEKEYTITSHFGALTMICIGAMFVNAQPVILSFPFQRPVFVREYASGLYGTAPYVFANTVINIPMTYLTIVVQLSCVYWLMGFNANWGLLSAILLLQGLAAGSMGLALGSLVADVSKGMEIAPLLLVPQILFAGFFVPLTQVPVWLRWCQYLCFLGYSIKLLILAEFEWTDSVKDKRAELEEEYGDQWPRVDPVLNSGAESDDAWFYIMVLLILFVAFRFVATGGLFLLGKQNYGT